MTPPRSRPAAGRNRFRQTYLLLIFGILTNSWVYDRIGCSSLVPSLYHSRPPTDHRGRRGNTVASFRAVSIGAKARRNPLARYENIYGKTSLSMVPSSDRNFDHPEEEDGEETRDLGDEETLVEASSFDQRILRFLNEKDAARIDNLVQERSEARRMGNYQDADVLKRQIMESPGIPPGYKIVLQDIPRRSGGGSRWNLVHTKEIYDESLLSGPGILQLAHAAIGLAMEDNHGAQTPESQQRRQKHLEDLADQAKQKLGILLEETRKMDEINAVMEVSTKNTLVQSELGGRTAADAALWFALAGCRDPDLLEALADIAGWELQRFGRRPSFRRKYALQIVERFAAAGLRRHDKLEAIARACLLEKEHEGMAEGNPGSNVTDPDNDDRDTAGNEPFFDLHSDRSKLLLWKFATKQKKQGTFLRSTKRNWEQYLKAGFDNQKTFNDTAHDPDRNYNPSDSTDKTTVSSYDWNELFQNASRPLVVDVGCGMGVSLLGLASTDDDLPSGQESSRMLLGEGLKWSDCNFVGVDLGSLGIQYARAKAQGCGLERKVCFAIDTAENFCQQLDSYPGEIRCCMIQFPTPFRSPKKDNGNAQLPASNVDGFMVTENLLNIVRSSLHPNEGKLLLQSNCEDVAVWMRNLACRNVGFTAVDEDAKDGAQCSPPPRTQRIPQRTLDWISMDGERAEGRGWFQRQILHRKGATETELSCEINETPVSRCLLKVGKRNENLEIEKDKNLNSIGITGSVPTTQKQDEPKKKWDGMFTLLVQYKEREGHCNVPYDHKEDGKNLGTWLNNQHQSKKKGVMDECREKQLTEVGVFWDACGQKWENNFMLLLQYKDREGHCNVPCRHKEDGKNLGNWLDRQRQSKKKGVMDESREKRLKEVGVIWNAQEQLQLHSWDKMIMLLLQYKDREGHCNVPKEHKEDGKNLGRWLNNQRRSKQKGVMDECREKQLTEVGVFWDACGQKWENNFMLLLQYNDREGHCNVPQEHKEDGKNLGLWLSRQRQSKKKGVMDESREKRLKEVGVIWNAQEQLQLHSWDKMIMLLLQYKDREGHCNVPKEHKEDGKNLGTWLFTQRRSKKEGVMDESKEKQLTEMGVIWDAVGQRWENNFMLLLQYKDREGHCNVPKEHEEDGRNLGTWLSGQRQRRKKGVMDESREKRLTEVGVIWNAQEQLQLHSWDKMIMLLLQYKDREGHCDVPKEHKEDGKNLGRWLHNQRTNKKEGIMDESKEKQLTEVGVIWDVHGQVWENNFMLLLQYKDREGHCNVPRTHKEDGKNLGNWLSTQRRSKKEGVMDESKEKQLTEIGVQWSLRTHQRQKKSADNEWLDKFTLLVQYEEREGHCNVPKEHKEDGKNLGLWLSRQRQSKKKGVMDESKEKQLTEVGVIWDARVQVWEEKFLLLLQYKEREGHCIVPSEHKEDGKNLGRWLRHLRDHRKKGLLEKSREKRLTEVGVIWNTQEQLQLHSWDKMITLLLQYKDREGHCNVPRTHKEDGKNLGNWLSTQRQSKKEGVMDESKEKQLTEMGVIWDAVGQKWENNFMLLLQYKDREGHCNVPQEHKEDGKNLGRWLSTQRQRRKKGVMDEIREKKLSEVGVIWDARAVKEQAKARRTP